MSLIKLTIEGISYSQTQNGAYALILKEENGIKKLPIVIGGFEAQSIAIAREKEIKPPRPLTHDLFKNFADRFGIIIKQVIIHKLVDGVFFSSIICERDKIEEIFDARTSDAVSLAIRFDASIFTYQNILDKAGVYMHLEEEENHEELEPNVPDSNEIRNVPVLDPYANFTLKELHQKLEEAVQNEDYEKAAKIRDEITKKES
jgi:bifunctional DNase/RNase